MMTEREKLVLMALLTIGAAILLWAFSGTFRQNIGDMPIIQGGEFKAHDAPIVQMALSRDGTILATAAKDHLVKLWRLSDRHPLHTLKGHTDTITSLAFSPDGKLLVSGSVDMTVRVYSVDDGKLVLKLGNQTPDWHTGWIQAVAISPDGNLLVTGSRDTTVKLWKLKTGEPVRTLWGHYDTVTSLAFSPAEKNLLASGSTDGTIWVWDVQTGEAVSKLPAQGWNPQVLAFTPDGKRLAIGSYASTGIRLIDWRKGQQLVWCHGGLEGNVWTIDISSNGQYLVAGAGDNGVWIYDITKLDEHKSALRVRTIRQTVERHKGTDYWGDARGVAFLPDDKTIVAAFEDGYVRKWRLTGLLITIPTPKLPSLPDEHAHRH